MKNRSYTITAELEIPKVGPRRTTTRFTGIIRKIVIGVGPVGEAFDPPLEWNGVG